MSIFRRLGWFEPQPDRVLPTDREVRCPICHEDRAMPSLLILRRVVIREGRVVSIIDGDRLGCQVCGCVFSVDSHGTFRHHPQALPYMPQGPSLGPAPAPSSSGDAQEKLRPPVLPMPLERPRV
jgi:hypothetical protein